MPSDPVVAVLAAFLALVAFFGVDFAAWVRDEKRRARAGRLDRAA